MRLTRRPRWHGQRCVRSHASSPIPFRQEVEFTVGSQLVAAGGELIGSRPTWVRHSRGSQSHGNQWLEHPGSWPLIRCALDPRRVARGVWVSDYWQGTRWSFEAGVRIDRSRRRVAPVSPRVSASWDLSARTKLRAAIGRYTTPGYESRSRATTCSPDRGRLPAPLAIRN